MIINRYIYQEIAQKLLWVFSILILILTSKKFVSYAAEAAEGSIPTTFIYKMLGYKMLANIPDFLPFSLFIAILVALSNLKKERELVAMAAMGVTSWQQIIATLYLIVPISGIMFVLVFWLSPWGEKNFRITQHTSRKVADYTNITPGSFKLFNTINGVVFVEQIAENGKTMLNVFLKNKARRKQAEIIHAKQAEFVWDEQKMNRYLILTDGKRYVGDPGQRNFKITSYKNYAILIKQTKTDQNTSFLAALPTKTLLKSSSRLDYQAELQWRISLVFSCLLLALLATIMVQQSTNERKSPLFFGAILICFTYSNLLGIAKAMLEGGKIPSYIGLWWVHLLLIFCLVFLHMQPRIHRYLYQKRP